ncbi:MAG: peptidoglycan DD-metalloendopeptidase family protein [Calditrichaeota bacterium]|nr:peptidoglycan DD-metalloendopeptidase family protein [Calditrichota bacterium]
MLGQILGHIVTHLVIPFSIYGVLWRARFKTRVDWLFMGLISLCYTVYIYLSGRWDWLGYPLRNVLLLFFAISLIRSIFQNRAIPFFVPRLPAWNFVYFIQTFVILLFGSLAFFAFQGTQPPPDRVSLAFPLKHGTFYVAQGGNSAILNYHHLSESPRFALDITRLQDWGRRASGIFPGDPTHYYIYGDTVFSPCDGVVFVVQDSLPDLFTNQVDTAHIAGNYVGIRFEQYNVFLAHLQPYSIQVKVGDTVRVGQPLGRVGNSGATSEPVLHIHVEQGSQADILSRPGVPIAFNGRFLVRNDRVVIP